MNPCAAEAFVHASPPWFARWRGKSAHVVYGLRMYPFNLWHLHLLDARNNPFGGAANGAGTEAHLQDAVRICSRGALEEMPVRHDRGWERKLRLIYLPRRAREIAAWIKSGQPPAAFIGSEHEKFLTYLRDYASFPSFWQGKDSRNVSSPIALYRVMLLKHLFNWPEEKCWAAPTGEAVWRCTAMLEAQGNDPKIMSEEERQACLTMGYKV